jgi:hypothetical protein
LASLSDARCQSPVNKLAISSKVIGDGDALADGLQAIQTEPPPWSEKNLCGPGASQREQIVNEGA